MIFHKRIFIGVIIADVLVDLNEKIKSNFFRNISFKILKGEGMIDEFTKTNSLSLDLFFLEIF